ncbi:Hypothetical predicted protein [Olea europaea subsp. europaea]|uniref:Uncharacterized protein n=1 Tax=Olea europaea subsp. europaea TaxID=158383 RepID=A0A8S0UJF8_OLEEU|nr:Hypothetical predicted protein [Olea europaea subsp. europaea]
MLMELKKKMKVAGYVPDTSFALYDLEDEERESEVMVPQREDCTCIWPHCIPSSNSYKDNQKHRGLCRLPQCIKIHIWYCRKRNCCERQQSILSFQRQSMFMWRLLVNKQLFFVKGLLLNGSLFYRKPCSQKLEVFG